MGSLISLLRPEFTWLRPDFTWSQPCPSKISETTPLTPKVPGPLTRRICGWFHAILPKISIWICRYHRYPYNNVAVPLPFGLLLKWSDRVSLEEFAAMKMARAAGMPVPLVLTCGEHPSNSARYSILMTRLPGYEMDFPPGDLDVESEQPWISQLRACLSAMRKWESPYGQRICSVLGTNIHSTRIPHWRMGPFETEDEMHDFLLAPSSNRGFPSEFEYEATVKHANDIRKYLHRITFTHGDLKHHQLLIGDDGSLTGLLDWESAGWYPEYWDFSTVMRWGRDSWWYQVTKWLGGECYMEQMECDRALNKLTVDSYMGG